MQEQAQKKNPFGGGDDPVKGAGFKTPERKAPESKDVLAGLDTAIQEQASKAKEKSTQESRRKEILKRCGCL